MWLLVGLGNPGDKYADTRHNLGFMVIDRLAAKYSVPLKQKTTNLQFGRGFIEEEKAILMKPLTFMNNSGIAIWEAITKFEEIENILVIHDDLDLAPGVIKIRKKGSSGGHNGIASIIQRLGSNDFTRLKIGIGRPERMAIERYVLRSFNKEERDDVLESIETAVEAVPVILGSGITRAQNMYH